MVEHEKYSWNWFHENMAGLSKHKSEQLKDRLDLIEEMDSCVGDLLDRRMSYASTRPQDYVVSILIMRAFRLAIGAIHLSTSGYPDSSPNLDRTIWEIGVRLLDIKKDPVSSSLGFLLQGCMEEIKVAETELEHFRTNALDTRNIVANLDMMRNYYEHLSSIARSKNLDPKKLQNKHGKINIRNICKSHGIDKAYRTTFSFLSGYTHEKNIASDSYMSYSDNRQWFNLGIVNTKEVDHSVGDTLNNLALVLSLAAEIVEDSTVLGKAEILLSKANSFHPLYHGEG